MPSLLVMVFLLQLLIHVVNAINKATINDLLWGICNQIPFLPTSQDAREQLRLRREVVRLKREMAAISAQDDFARWAKLRRDHDKTLAEHDKKASVVSSAKASFDTKASIFRWLATSGLRFFLQFWHAKKPVYTFPRGWLPWYIEWTLAFPRSPSGGVSINVWWMACGATISLMADLVEYSCLLGAPRSRLRYKVAESEKPVKSGTGIDGLGDGQKKEL